MNAGRAVWTRVLVALALVVVVAVVDRGWESKNPFDYYQFWLVARASERIAGREPAAVSRPSMTIDFARALNEEQLAAVTHAGSPQLVVAGAGSGKTRVITHRIAWLAAERGVDPAAIVAVTFTNKAAGEMRDRAERLLATWPLPAFVGTFHRFALRLLRRHGERIGLARDFAILDEADQKALLVQAMAAEKIPESAFPPRAILAAISAAKNRLETPESFERGASGSFEQRTARAWRRYDALCRKVSGADFDDLLTHAVRLLAEEPEVADRVRARCRALLVDEFQDTNLAQLRLVTALVGPAGDLTAVGDEDQGIYRWRGADLSNVLEFERHFPGATIRKLERNYRSTATILDAANAVVAHNRLRRGKRLFTDAGRGERLRLFRLTDEAEEAQRVVAEVGRLRVKFELAQQAILVRTNAQTRAFEDELFQAHVPYTLVGGVRFYERAEIKDLVAYLRVLRNPRDNVSLSRILNQPPRGIGKTTVALLAERAAEETGGVLWDLLALDRLDRFPNRAAQALRAFRDLVRELSAAAAELPLPALLDQLLARTRYLDLFRPELEEERAKLENVREFLTAAQSFTEARAVAAAAPARAGGPDADPADDDLLTAFLDHVALVSDLDSWEAERGVTLMTLHSAKGLEFPVVFLCGLEEGLLPHFNAQASAEETEEERRLLYVGMTRAERRLLLTTCRRRRIAGRYQDQLPSRFLAEVPEALVEVEESPALFAGERTRAIDAFFGRPERASYAPEPPARGPRRGARVRHPTLGDGVVLEIEGEGEDAKLTVFFARAGKRRLVARYAALEPA
jgi:DNA helicase-2/ATP-dependent DNA helicase PcrA